MPSAGRGVVERLQSEHIRGADLVFACIGPAWKSTAGIQKVVDAEDREIPLGGDPEATESYKRGYLAYVWEAVGRAALEQVLGTAEATARNGAAGALEEDARLTALFLWTLQSTNGQEAKGARREAREEQPEEDSDEEEENSPKKKEEGFDARIRCRAAICAAAGDLSRQLGRPYHRDGEGNRSTASCLRNGDRSFFGQDGADLVAERLEREPAATFQLTLFPDKTDAAPTIKGKKGRGRRKQEDRVIVNSKPATKRHARSRACCDALASRR